MPATIAVDDAVSPCVWDRMGKEEGLLETVFDTVPVGLWVIDTERRLQRTNRFAAQLLRRSLEDLLGALPGEALDCVHRHDAPGGCGAGPACQHCRLNLAAQDTLATGKQVFQLFHEVHRSIDGEEQVRQMRVSLAPLEMAGMTHLALVALEDVTEVIATEKELSDRRVADERIRALSETAAAVAHELSQPLQAVVGSVDLALVKNGGGEDLDTLLKRIRENADRIVELVTHMQTLTEYSTREYGADGRILDVGHVASGRADTRPGGPADHGIGHI